ncbi:MAG: restriction endonuclease subunit S [Clostridiales bacterium]|nr:restriction endonuclease subunit S [Clostridiales bacterium]
MGRAMKDSGVEWIGEIPEDWRAHRVKNHFRIISGSGFKPDLQGKLDGDYPVCKASDISSAGRLLFSASNYITKEIAKENGFSVIPKDSILFPKIGEAMRKNSRTLCMVDCCADNNCQGLVPQDMVSEYSYFLFSCIDMTWFDNASTIPCINNQKLYDCFIPYPGKAEQERIATFLTLQCTQIKSIISQTRASIEEYKRLKQAAITQAVTKGVRGDRPMKESGIEWVGDIPADWNVQRIKTIFSMRDERNNLPLEEVNLISLYTDLGVVQHADLENTTGNKASNADGYKKVYENDIVVNIILCWMGAIGRSAYNGVTSPAYDIYVPSEKIDCRFYHYYFRTSGFSGDCYKNGRGIMAMRWRTYSDEFRSIRVVVPPKEEQTEIASYLDQKCAEIDALIAKKEQLLTELESYKKSLIYEYVTGKKEVAP